MTTLMWPPPDGSRNTVYFDGRSYSAAPGMSAAVQKFDVPVMQANRWTVFPTSPGQTFIPMTTQVGRGGPLTVNGRSYSAQPGELINVLRDDAGILETAGWIRNSNMLVPQPAVIQIPAGAIGVFSQVRTSIGGVVYNGPCCQVKRASDHTTMDIGWNGNVVDWATADAFAAGSLLEVPIWYDQSGVGNNFANPTNDRAPLFVRESHWKGIRPLTGELISLGTNPRYLQLTLTTPPDQNALTVYHIGANRTSFDQMMHYEGLTAGFAGTRMSLADLQGNGLGLRSNRNGLSEALNKTEVSQLECLVQSSGATSFVDLNGTQISIAAAGSQVLPCWNIFWGSGGTSYNYLGDKFFMAFYPANHSSATVTANRATFLAGFSPNTALQDHLLIFSGNSMQVGSRSTKAQSLQHIMGFDRASEDDAGSPFVLPSLPNWRVRNIAVSGRTLANEIAHWNAGNLGTNIVDPGMARVVYMSGSPTNDIAGSTYASTAAAQAAMDALYATFVTFVGTLKAAGVNAVVAATCIPRTSFALGTGNFFEDARLRWNANLTSGAAANGYTVSDWCSLAAFSTQTSYTNLTYYFGDNIHPNDTGYALIAALDRAAILAA